MKHYFEAIKMTSQAKSKFTGNTLLRLEFSTRNLTRLNDNICWMRQKNKTKQQMLVTQCYIVKPRLKATGGGGGGVLKHFRYRCVSPIFLGEKNLRIGDIFGLVVPEELESILLGKRLKT